VIDARLDSIEIVETHPAEPVRTVGIRQYGRGPRYELRITIETNGLAAANAMKEQFLEWLGERVP
jgi:hypothetical protein